MLVQIKLIVLIYFEETAFGAIIWITKLTTIIVANTYCTIQVINSTSMRNVI